jgi:hypothetical protein
VGVGAVVERWFESASMRRVADEGIRGREVRIEDVDNSFESRRGERVEVLRSALDMAL